MQQLLRAHVESFEQLLVLLWFCRNHARAWSLDEIAAAVHAAELEGALDHLCAHRLLERQTDRSGARYVYNPRPPSLAWVIEALARVHDENPVDIVRLLNANAIERIRSAAIVTFGEPLGGKDER